MTLNQSSSLDTFYRMLSGLEKLCETGIQHLCLKPFKKELDSKRVQTDIWLKSTFCTNDTNVFR